MALTYSQTPQLGSIAPSFSLPSAQGPQVSLSQFELDSQARFLLVAFICNHCPYVKAIRSRLQRFYSSHASHGLKMVGINSNDPVKYPADSLEMMKQEVLEQGYTFPYLQDLTQEVARSYGAVCTPDFFLYSKEKEKFALRYAGRMDDSWKDETQVRQRDLEEAMQALISGKMPSLEQIPSMGCSIKWK